MENNIFKDLEAIVSSKKAIVSNSTNVEPGIGVKFSLYDGSNLVTFVIGLINRVHSLRQDRQNFNKYKLVYFKEGTDEYLDGPLYSGGLTGFGISSYELRYKKSFKDMADLIDNVGEQEFFEETYIVYNDPKNPLKAIEIFLNEQNRKREIEKKDEERNKNYIKRVNDQLSKFEETIVLNDGSKYLITCGHIKSIYGAEKVNILIKNITNGQSNYNTSLSIYLTPTGKASKKALHLNSDPTLAKELINKILDIKKKWTEEINKIKY